MRSEDYDGDEGEKGERNLDRKYYSLPKQKAGLRLNL